MSRLPLLTLVLGCAVLAAASYRPPSNFAATERARIRAHLDSVERELRARDVSHLTPAQRAARARDLDVLHAYWVRGIFPQNTDFPGRRVPYFIDRYGTRCAMAYLIEQAGGMALVTRVAATDNNARIPELRGDPELRSWLWRNGITLAEAARIQPAYGCCPLGALCFAPGPPCPSTSTSASAGYKTATGLAVSADVVAVALNGLRAAPAPVAGVLGVATGIAGIAIGAPNFDESGSRRTLGYVNAGVGAASATLGVIRLAHRHATGSRLAVAPLLGARGRAGIAARVSF